MYAIYEMSDRSYYQLLAILVFSLTFIGWSVIKGDK